jgi:hypothetical protein
VPQFVGGFYDLLSSKRPFKTYFSQFLPSFTSSHGRRLRKPALKKNEYKTQRHRHGVKPCLTPSMNQEASHESTQRNAYELTGAVYPHHQTTVFGICECGGPRWKAGF